MTDQPKHPLQPRVRDSTDVERFKVNNVIRWLMQSKFQELVTLWKQGEFNDEDMQQVAQQAGYTTTSYVTLPFVDDDAISRLDDENDQENAIKLLNEKLNDANLIIEQKEAKLNKIKVYINRA